MYESVRQIKNNNERKKKISYLINLAVVILTLIVIYQTQSNLTLTCFPDVDTFIGLLAFGLSIAIFLFRPEGDTRVDYIIANNYWLLYKRIQDILYHSENEEYMKNMQNEIASIKAERNALTRLTPTFKPDKVKNAIKYIKKGYFLYHSDDELKIIKEHFEKIY